jgi:lipoprotein-releasing system permease protein
MMTMVVVLSVMGGFGNAIEKRILSFEPHIIVKSKNPDRRIQKNDLSALSHELEKKFPLNSFLFDQEQVIFRTASGHYNGAIAKGLEEKSLQHFIEAARLFGTNKIKKFSWKDDPETPMVINDSDVMVGADLAYESGVLIGDQIVLTPPESLLLPPGEVPEFKKMNVQDLLRTSVQNIDAQTLIYKKVPNQTLFKESMSLETELEIYLENSSQMDAVLSQIDKSKFAPETWKERNSSLFYSLKMEKLLIGFFLFLSVLIGCFTIVTVLVLLTTQKQADIGILLTLGMKRKELVKRFSHIGFFLSSAGVVGGFAVGIFICLLLASHEFIILPDVYYDRTIPVQFSYPLYALVLVIALAISYVSAVYPARIISSMEISQILRKKS